MRFSREFFVTTQRWHLTLEYDGSRFSGWQKQPKDLSVQETIEKACLDFCGEEIQVFGAGRTDAGVHALGQSAHMDLAHSCTPFQLCLGINHYLKQSGTSILSATPVPADFHARFSATKRTYLYQILNRRAPPTLERERVWFVPRPLNEHAMREAALRLLGHKDFSSFRSAGCDATSPVKTMREADVRRDKELVSLSFSARSFLYRQVRGMVGSLVQVGLGRWSVEKFAEILAACDRTKAGPNAPAHGLYLAGVIYEENAKDSAT